MRLVVPALLVVAWLAAPSLASARILPAAELSLIDRPADLALDADAVRLLDVRLDDGGGAAAGAGGLLPAILSLVLPGLGQVWNGQIIKGIVVFAIVAVLYGGGWWLQNLAGLLGVIVHAFAVVDAYQGGGLIPNIGGGGDVPESLRRQTDRVATRWLDARPAIAQLR